MCSAYYCANELLRRVDLDKWIQSPAGVTETRVNSNSGGHLSGVGGVGGGLPALHGPHSYPQQLNHLTSQYTPASWGGGGGECGAGNTTHGDLHSLTYSVLYGVIHSTNKGL